MFRAYSPLRFNAIRFSCAGSCKSAAKLKKTPTKAADSVYLPFYKRLIVIIVATTRHRGSGLPGFRCIGNRGLCGQ